MNAAVIGGDARQLQMIKDLQHSLDRIWVVGFDSVSFAHTAVKKTSLAELPWNSLTAVLFPIGGVRDEGEVDAYEKKETLTITPEMIASTPSSCKLFTGVITPFLKQSHANREMICWMVRDDVAISNSVPTAEGALMLAMQKTTRTIHDAKTIVLGYGRCGFTIAQLFQAVGARVCVVTDSTKESARAVQMGHEVETIANVGSMLADADICVNTIPALVVDKHALKHAKRSCYLLDIASAPGGCDLKFAQALGMTAESAPGLPGRIAPDSAGEILAETTWRILVEKKV